MYLIYKNGSVPKISEVSSFFVVVLVLGLLNIDDTCGELTDVVKGCDVCFIKVVRSVDSVVVGIVVVTSVVVGNVVTSVVVGIVFVVVFNIVVIIGVDIMVVISSGKCTIN